MKLTRYLVFLLLIIAPVFISAQVSISANHVVDSFERPLTSGKLCFTPVDAASNPAGFRVGSMQVVPTAVCGVIANGVLQSGLSVAPSPAGVYYHIWAASRLNNTVIRDYGLAVITGSSWSLDNYDPSIVTVPASALTMGSVTTLPPGSSASCNLTGGNPYALNCAIPQAPGATEVSPSTQYTIPTYDSNSDLVHLGPSRVTTDANGDLAVPNNLSAGSANIADLFAGFVNGSTSVTSPWIQGKLMGSVYQVDQFGTGSFDQLISACITYGAIYGQQTLASNSVGNFTCDARRLTSSSNGPNTLTAAADITVTNQGVHVLLPCQAIQMGTHHIIVKSTSSYNVGSDTFEGCGQDATWLIFTGNDTFVQVGDPAFALDTRRVSFKHLAIMTNTAGEFAGAMAFYRTQDIDLEDVELNGKGGNSSTNPPSVQLGLLLNGTGNYTGGTFRDVHINSYPMAIDMKGHDSGSAIGDFANASTFERLHIDCPAQVGPNGVGIFAEAADGNTWIGGDIEGCYKMVELGANAINNTFVGVRNENSGVQYQADSGSSYNLVLSGGTLFTNQLIDYGSRNSFIDAFHHTQNGMKGDWYASQQDATVVNHLRLGTGTGNVRGLQWETQVDQGTSNSVYNWLWGLTDGTSGQQQWIYQDLINNVIRLLIQQNNTAGGNNQTALNAAGTGNVCFNCSANSGTGGVAFASGGPTPATVATVDGSGDAHFTGNSLTDGTTQSGGTMTVRNNADAEVDYYLWAGATAPQKESYTYKDWDGSAQWYMVKNQYNDWALNSAVGGLDSFKAYQSTNSGDTYINAQIPAGVVRINYEPGSGTAFKVYGGNSGTLYESFTAANAWSVPGLAASSGRNCLQIDNSGYISNTGSGCGTGNGSGTVNSGATGQIAYYQGNGAAVSGLNSVPVANGGTGATTPSGALSNLGAVSNATTVNGHPLTSNVTVTAADAGAVTKTNGLGCLDGYDHLPCTVYSQSAVSESAATGSYATVWTSTYAGVYRVSGYLYGTTASSTSCSVTEYAKAQSSGQSSGNGYSVATGQVGTSISSANLYPVVFNLAAGIPIQTESLVSSGSCTGGAWTRAVVIERMQ